MLNYSKTQAMAMDYLISWLIQWQMYKVMPRRLHMLSLWETNFILQQISKQCFSIDEHETSNGTISHSI